MIRASVASGRTMPGLRLAPSMQSSYDGDFVRPRSLKEAVVAVMGRELRILGGGTDIFPSHVARPLPSRLVDVSTVAEIRGIVAAGASVRIGGAATWTDIVAAKLPPPFRALQDAARQIGSLQVQNRGTIAGNLCNASPAADGVPPLLVLDAEVELASIEGLRRMPLAKFITGNRKTAIRADEVLSAVIVAETPTHSRSAFIKLGARKYLVISIVMAAALIRRDMAGTIVEARVAVGSASEKALRLGALERDLAGLPKERSPSSVLDPRHLSSLKPIDDIRATARYRADAARQLVSDALDRASEI